MPWSPRPGGDFSPPRHSGLQQPHLSLTPDALVGLQPSQATAAQSPGPAPAAALLSPGSPGFSQAPAGKAVPALAAPRSESLKFSVCFPVFQLKTLTLVKTETQNGHSAR